MAGTIVNNMTLLNGADSTTGWLGGMSLSLYTTFYREATGCLGDKISASYGTAYADPVTETRDMSNETIHGWALFYAGIETYANCGMGIIVGDGSGNTAGFPCAGSDKAGYAKTPDGWVCFILSVPDKVDSEAKNVGGTTANIDDTDIEHVGYYLAASSTALGNVDNVFFDVLHCYDHTGYACEITAGTSVSPASFSDLADYDASTADGRALGVLFEIALGVFSNTAPIQIGDDGTGTSYFAATTEEIIFENVGHLNNHKFAVVGNSTGDNEAYFTSFTFRNVHETFTSTLNFDGGNIDNLEFIGCAFINCTPNFSSTTDATGHVVTGCIFDSCGAIDAGSVSDFTLNTITGSGAVTHQGCDMTGTSILLSTVAADASALIYDEATDPDGEMDDMTFSKGTNAHHAIEFGTTSPLTMTLRGIAFSGYNTTDAANDSTLYFARTTGTVTVNLVGCTGNISYKTAGAIISLVSDPVTTELTVIDSTTKAAIQYAAVLIKASDGTGPLPFEDSVTITVVTTTATIAHTAHGLSTDDWIEMDASSVNAYNGLKQITVTGVNAYTYTVPSGLGNSTGEVTGVIINAETNASGVVSDTRTFSADQPWVGTILKGSSPPVYVRSDIIGTTDNLTGYSNSVPMISD